MKNIIIKYFLLALLFFGFFPNIYSQGTNERALADNPTQLKQYLVDETGILTPVEHKNILVKLVNEEKSTSNQIVVYLINSLNGESLEDVSIRLAEKNKIGKKDKNNGVLMLVVKNDRKIRIEVGYGLEGVLTDAKSSSIIRNVITPEFKKGDYYQGINNGVDAIIAAIKGEYTAEDNEPSGGSKSCCFGLPIFIVMIFIFIFLSIFTSVLRRIFGFGNSVRTGKKGSGNSWWGGGGGWSGGSSSGGSFGGFSGGGGSFGGGGASGSW